MNKSLKIFGIVFSLFMIQIYFDFSNPTGLERSRLIYTVGDVLESETTDLVPESKNQNDSQALESGSSDYENLCEVSHFCCRLIQFLLTNSISPIESYQTDIFLKKHNSGLGVVILVPSPPPRYA